MASLKETTFLGTYYPNASTNAFNWYLGPVTLNRVAGDSIPSDAIITNIVFTFKVKISGGMNEVFYVYDASKRNAPILDNNKNYIDSADCPRISNLKIVQTTTSTNPELEPQIFVGNELAKQLCKNTDTIKVTLCRSSQETSPSQAGNYYQDKEHSCVVTWHYREQTPTEITNVSLTPNQIYSGANDLITLKWDPSSLSTEAYNKIIGYSIRYKKQETSEEFNPIDDDYVNSQITSISFLPPNDIGVYIYIITPITELDGEYKSWPEASGETILTVQAVPVAGAPRAFAINTKNVLYLGENISSSKTFRLGWSAPTEGTEIISGYRIYNGSSVIATVDKNTISYSLSGTALLPGEYKIVAVLTNGSESDASNIVYVNMIQAATIPAPIVDTIITDNFQITWSNPLPIIGVNSVSYQLSYLYSDGLHETALANTSNTQYLFDIAEIEAGREFSIIIRATYYAIDGGFVTGITITDSILKAKELKIKTFNWLQCYDLDAIDIDKTKIWNHAYSSLQIAWGHAELEDPTSGTKLTYQLQQSINNGNYINIGSSYDDANFNNDINGWSINIDIGNLENGSLLQYQMVITDNYNNRATSTNKLSIIKITPPTLNNLIVSNITSEKLQSSLNYQRNLTMDADTLRYIVKISYGEESYTVLDTIVDKEEEAPTLTTIHSIDLKNLAFSEALANLKKTVINDRKIDPEGILFAELSYMTFPLASSSISTKFKFNYTTEPSNYGQLNFLAGKEWYNPGDTIVLTLTNFEWKDASGGTTGGEVKNYLTSSFSSNKFYFNENGQVAITAPQVSEDISITLTLTTSITYADRTIVYISPEVTSYRKIITIARWTSEPVLIDSLEGIKEEDIIKKIEGYIKLPENLCSSQIYNNLKNIQPTIEKFENINSNYTLTFYDLANNAIVPTDGKIIITPNLLSVNRKLYFTLVTEEAILDTTLQFKFKFINTSNQSLEINTNSYRFFSTLIDFAIRKGCIGINVGETFQTPSSGSTLQINAGVQSGAEKPIVEILSQTPAMEEAKVAFLKMSALADDNKIFESNISTDGTRLFIDKLSVKGTDGIIHGDHVVVTRKKSDGGYLVESSTITNTELGYLNNLQENVQDKFLGYDNSLKILESNMIPKNHAWDSEEDLYGFASSTHYGHARSADPLKEGEDSELPKQIGREANIGVLESVFARADHVHQAPLLSHCSGYLSVSKGGTGSTIAGAAKIETNIGQLIAGALWKIGLRYYSSLDSARAAAESENSEITEGFVVLIPKGA